MRKFTFLALVGVLVLSAWDTDSSACGRRRCHWRCQPTCVVFYSNPPLSVPAARQARVQVVSTKSFTSPGGRTYLIHQTSHQDTHEESQVETAAAEALTTAGEDNFRGTDRKVAKTSVVGGASEAYSSIDDLLKNRSLVFVSFTASVMKDRRASLVCSSGSGVAIGSTAPISAINLFSFQATVSRTLPITLPP